MAEYIEREGLLDAFENADTNVCEDYGDSCEWGYDLERVKEIIHGVPATDVVSVVRCRDCRKRGTPECPMETEYPWIDIDSDGFCNQGVKKKAGDDSA